MASKKKLIYILLLILVLTDLTYSFCQYYTTPLDGDIAGGVVPDSFVEEIFEDPFGFNAIANNSQHANPNRYFSHLLFRDYFKHVPLSLQAYVSPIESIYITTSIAKIILHLLLLYLLAAIISGVRSAFKMKFLMGVVLVFPFLQANGYSGYMGIIDSSPTFTFFYALPLIFTFLAFFPFYKLVYLNEEVHFSIPVKILLLLSIIILPFSGPLIPAICIIVTFLLLLYYLKKYLHISNRKAFGKELISYWKFIPKAIRFYFITISIISLYSLFLGTYNNTFEAEKISLAERYMRLPAGIYYQLTQKLGPILLLISIAVNLFIIHHYYSNEASKRIMTSIKWIGLFALIYILLLPLGGYRPYRPNILRYDTFMPITVCMIYLFGKSSFHIFTHIQTKKVIYLSWITCILVIFTVVDTSTFEENKPEREAFEFIAKSDDAIVVLDKPTKVLTWNVIYTPQESLYGAELLKQWNITKTMKLYYYKEENESN